MIGELFLNICRDELIEKYFDSPLINENGTTKMITYNNQSIYVKIAKKLIEAYMTRLIFLIGRQLEIPITEQDFIFNEYQNYIISESACNEDRMFKLPRYRNIYEALRIIQTIARKHTIKQDIVESFLKQQLFALFIADSDRRDVNTRVIKREGCLEMAPLFDFNKAFLISDIHDDITEDLYYYNDDDCRKDSLIKKYNAHLNPNERRMDEDLLKEKFSSIYEDGMNKFYLEDYGSFFGINPDYNMTELEIFCLCMDNIKDKEFIEKLLCIDSKQLLADDYHKYNERSILVLTSLVEFRKAKFRQYYESYESRELTGQFRR